MVQPCDDISDFELIRRMADRQTDSEGARTAWAHFYIRHHDSLSLVCAYDYGYLLGQEGVEDLVQDTFWRAFERAGTFDHAEVCDTLVQPRKCRGWLARIAENLVRDRYREQPQLQLTDDEEIERLAG